MQYSFLAAYIDASCPIPNLLTDRDVRPARAFQPSYQKWRQSGLSPQRSTSTLKSKGGCIAEKEKLGHSTSISLLGCHLSDSVGRYWFDFFFPLPSPVVQNPFQMQKGEKKEDLKIIYRKFILRIFLPANYSDTKFPVSHFLQIFEEQSITKSIL